MSGPKRGLMQGRDDQAEGWRDTLFGLLAAIALVGVIAFGGCLDKTPDVCFEDEPCFDCETMGNRECGPAND